VLNLPTASGGYDLCRFEVLAPCLPSDSQNYELLMCVVLATSTIEVRQVVYFPCRRADWPSGHGGGLHHDGDRLLGSGWVCQFAQGLTAAALAMDPGVGVLDLEH